MNVGQHGSDDVGSGQGLAQVEGADQTGGAEVGRGVGGRAVEGQFEGFVFTVVVGVVHQYHGLAFTCHQGGAHTGGGVGVQGVERASVDVGVVQRTGVGGVDGSQQAFGRQVVEGGSSAGGVEHQVQHGDRVGFCGGIHVRGMSDDRLGQLRTGNALLAGQVSAEVQTVCARAGSVEVDDGGFTLLVAGERDHVVAERAGGEHHDVHVRASIDDAVVVGGAARASQGGAEVVGTDHGCAHAGDGVGSGHGGGFCGFSHGDGGSGVAGEVLVGFQHGGLFASGQGRQVGGISGTGHGDLQVASDDGTVDLGADDQRGAGAVFSQQQLAQHGVVVDGSLDGLVDVVLADGVVFAGGDVGGDFKAVVQGGSQASGQAGLVASGERDGDLTLVQELVGHGVGSRLQVVDLRVLCSHHPHGLVVLVAGVVHVHGVVARASGDVELAGAHSVDGVVAFACVDVDVVQGELVHAPLAVFSVDAVGANVHGQGVVASTAVDVQLEVFATGQRAAGQEVAVHNDRDGVVVGTTAVSEGDVVGSRVGSGVAQVQVLGDGAVGDLGVDVQLAGHGRSVDQAHVGETEGTVVDARASQGVSTGQGVVELGVVGLLETTHGQAAGVLLVFVVGVVHAAGGAVNDHDFLQRVVGGVDGLQLAVVFNRDFEALHTLGGGGFAHRQAAHDQVATGGATAHVVEDDLGGDQLGADLTASGEVGVQARVGGHHAAGDPAGACGCGEGVAAGGGQVDLGARDLDAGGGVGHGKGGTLAHGHDACAEEVVSGYLEGSDQFFVGLGVVDGVGFELDNLRSAVCIGGGELETAVGAAQQGVLAVHDSAGVHDFQTHGGVGGADAAQAVLVEVHAVVHVAGIGFAHDDGDVLRHLVVGDAHVFDDQVGAAVVVFDGGETGHVGDVGVEVHLDDLFVGQVVVAGVNGAVLGLELQVLNAGDGGGDDAGHDGLEGVEAASAVDVVQVAQGALQADDGVVASGASDGVLANAQVGVGGVGSGQCVFGSLHGGGIGGNAGQHALQHAQIVAGHTQGDAGEFGHGSLVGQLVTGGFELVSGGSFDGDQCLEDDGGVVFTSVFAGLDPILGFGVVLQAQGGQEFVGKFFSRQERGVQGLEGASLAQGCCQGTKIFVQSDEGVGKFSQVGCARSGVEHASHQFQDGGAFLHGDRCH